MRKFINGFRKPRKQNIIPFRILFLIAFLFPISMFSQTQKYLISDGGTHTTCSGSFYDSGDSTGNYGDNEDDTITFCSADTGVAAIVVVDFTTAVFKSQDHLYIYDGPTTSDPLLYDMTNNTYSGSVSSSGSCLTFRFVSNQNQNDIGWDATVSCYICGDAICNEAYEDCSTCSNDCNNCPDASGGPYFHPTDGVGGSYTGTCMVNTCSGSYYDDGGPSSTYSDNINNIYRTFCPDQAGKCIQMTVNNLDLEYSTSPAGCYDYIYILDGPVQNSPTIWEGCGSTSVPQILTIDGTYSNVYTSSDSSGCLTVRFYSDASNVGTWDGWDFSIACVDCSQGPSGTAGNDCSNATVVCSDGSFSDNSTGPGLSSDACTGCITSEVYSSWYYFEPSVGGTIELTIVPDNSSDDYDFALYEATSCNDLGSPVRCSYASNTGNTGMANGSGDIAEDASGDGWVNGIDAPAGQGFFLLVNKWSAGTGTSGFSLNWNFPDGASLDCSVILPIELKDFSGKCTGNNRIQLSWSTLSEINNDYFEIQRSVDGKNFKKIGKVKGAGNSSTAKTYFFVDDLNTSDSYYRLKQVDFDGNHSYSKIIFVGCEQQYTISSFHIYPNPAKENTPVNIVGETKNIRIVDVYGRTIIPTIKDNKILGLKSGVYCVTNNKKTVQLIIQ